MMASISRSKTEHLLKIISSQRFLKKEGLGNEVPFFICPYEPTLSNEMAKSILQLIKRLPENGVNALKIDIYDLTQEILREQGLWETIFETELNATKDEFKEYLQDILDVEHHLIPKMSGIMKNTDFDVMFITGIGEVFPYIRSHYVLNNLQKVATNQPTVMFFPGEYVQSLEEGASLSLFTKLQDDKYYRAFNIMKYEI